MKFDLPLACLAAASLIGSVAAVDLPKTAGDGAFLAEYANKEGAVVMKSGLVYRELRPGTGGSPKASDPCLCHCESSYDVAGSITRHAVSYSRDLSHQMRAVSLPSTRTAPRSTRRTRGVPRQPSPQIK